MSDTRTPPERTADHGSHAPASGPRWFLWITGGILWGLVAAAVMVFLVVGRRGSNVDGRDAKPSSIIVDDRSSSADSQPSSVQAPLGTWDPAGIEDFEFLECRGGTVTKQDLLGKPWVVCFVFTRCVATCPTIMRSMWELEQSLVDVDMRFVTLTVDPEFDTVEVLRREAENYSAPEDRWLFLTGDRGEIYHLIWNSFKMEVKEIQGPERQPGFEVLHSNNIMLVDTEGVVVGKYNGIVASEMAQLRRRIRELVENVADGTRERHGEKEADGEKESGD